jgi:hypothetical protein
VFGHVNRTLEGEVARDEAYHAGLVAALPQAGEALSADLAARYHRRGAPARRPRLRAWPPCCANNLELPGRNATVDDLISAGESGLGTRPLAVTKLPALTMRKLAGRRQR